ncbi:Capsule biosynthesis protein CapA [bacterium HR35]|nr:Capsule biosynthesis protein CapA [bacterium HR35]
MMKYFKYFVIFLLIALFFAFVFRSQIEKLFFKPQETISQKLEQGKVDNNFEVVLENLEIPWSIVFLNENEVLITERPGRVKIFDLKDKKLIKEFEIKEVKHIGEGGLLGAALHPNFKENNFIYFYYTTEKNGKLINRVERYTLKNYLLEKDKVILDDIPANRFHNGGRIKFGPDGYLYITTGDAGNSENSQNINSLAGKILRIKDDGSIPEDNPFKNAVYAYGIRNSQGIAWDDEGNLWSIDHGRSGIQTGLDEINLIEKGKNYGWPVIQGDERKEGMESPVIHSGPDITWAPADLIYFQNSLFFTGLRGEGLYQYDLVNKRLKVYFFQKFGRLRAITIGPDGYFYISTSNRDGRGYPKEGDDKIIKIKPEIFFPIESKEIKILLIGDIMMNRNVENKILKNNSNFVFPFEKILDYLKSFDYVVANLEGPITDKGQKVGSKYSFKMKPEVVEALIESNINILNLANNHIFDYGRTGLEETLKNLEKNNIEYFGNSYDPLIIEINNTKIGFLGFSDFLKHLDAEKNNNGIAVINENFENSVKKAKEKVDILIVSFHWGDEYKKFANQRQQKFARLAIDSGVDLVVGHHPHVIQNIEKYKNKYIFYSLGNFIFDQNFSEDTMIGGGVEVYIKNKKIDRISFRKFYLNNDFQIEKISDLLLPYQINNKIYLLKIADEPLEWERGLMFVRKPIDFDGMIFIFPDKQIRSFWNKNTLVDLDIYWLDDDKIIGKDFLPSIEKTKGIYTITSPVPVNKVIEIIK